MGRRVIVIVWLMVSLTIDVIHLSETTFILSRPDLVKTWPVLVAVCGSYWQELKIVRIKYRIIRRSLMVDSNNNPDDKEYEPETLHQEIQSHCDSRGKLHLRVVSHADSLNNDDDCGNLSLISIPLGSIYESSKKAGEPKEKRDCVSRYIANNAVHFIKLLRNLYNLLTWHFTGYLFGGDYLHLISTQHLTSFTKNTYDIF